MGDMNKQRLRERENNIIQLVATFCNEHLDEECAALCTQLVQKLGCQHPCLFESGRLEIWAAASVYTICSINLLFDRRKPLSLSSSDICDFYGVSHSTITQKNENDKRTVEDRPSLRYGIHLEGGSKSPSFQSFQEDKRTFFREENIKLDERTQP